MRPRLGPSKTDVMSRASRVLAVLRNRDFGLLWAGMGVSVVGDGFYRVALVWQVYELSDTPTALAIVGAAATVPNVLLGLAGGVRAVSLDTRRTVCLPEWSAQSRASSGSGHIGAPGADVGIRHPSPASTSSRAQVVMSGDASTTNSWPRPTLRTCTVVSDSFVHLVTPV